MAQTVEHRRVDHAFDHDLRFGRHHEIDGLRAHHLDGLARESARNAHFVEIHRLENVADDIYFRAIGNLFKNTTDPIEVIKWKEFLEILENATDRAESVANIIESIVLKHT